jgi:hypothetical protein
MSYSKNYAKKRLIYFMDQSVEAIEELQNWHPVNYSGFRECVIDYEYFDLLEKRRRSERGIKLWKHRLDNYEQLPKPAVKSRAYWKDDGRYVCHVDIPEEYEA